MYLKKVESLLRHVHVTFSFLKKENFVISLVGLDNVLLALMLKMWFQLQRLGTLSIFFISFLIMFNSFHLFND